MALRILFVLLGLLEIVFPKQLVDFWMNLAAADDDVDLKSWVYTAARIEGAVFLLWALRNRRSEEAA